MFYCGHVRLGFTQGPLHSSRHFLGRAGWWWRMGWPINQPVGIYCEIIAVLFPSPPSKTGWRAGGKKAASHMEGSYLDWALADFSGYIAADELYDGPFCVLFVVDNRTFKRLLYQVLDHDPGHKDIEAFLRRFEKALRQRGLVLQGVTTDGSPLTGDGDLAYLTVVSGQFHGLVNVPEALMTTLCRVDHSPVPLAGGQRLQAV